MMSQLELPQCGKKICFHFKLKSLFRELFDPNLIKLLYLDLTSSLPRTTNISMKPNSKLAPSQMIQSNQIS